MTKTTREVIFDPTGLEEGCRDWALDLAERFGDYFRVDDSREPGDESSEAEEQRKYRNVNTFYHESELVKATSVGSQSLERVHINNLLWLTNEANAVFEPGSFNAAVEQLKNNRQLIQEIEYSVAARQNIALLTNHAALSSPFIEELALASALSNARIATRMGMTLSPTLGWVDTRVNKDPATREPGYMNTIKVGAKLFNTWLAIPQESDNAVKFGMDRYAHDYNFRTLRQMLHALRDEPGRIEAMSASGSLDQMPSQEKPEIVMKGVGSTTAKLIGGRFDKAMWIVSWINPTTRRFELRSSDSLIPLGDPESERDSLLVRGNPDKVHEIMRQMIEPYQKLVNAGREGVIIPVSYIPPAAKLGNLGTKAALS